MSCGEVNTIIPQGSQVILTGIPRSGTTLACHLLNKLPNCVALHEPITAPNLLNKNKEELVDFIDDFFFQQREQILQTGTALSKSLRGSVPDNPRAGFDPVTGKRIAVNDGNTLIVSKKLGQEFFLIMKHPVFFTGILDSLINSKRFNCFAIIRNPLAVLLSWNSVDMPVSNGRIPGAEAFDVDLKKKLDSIKDLYDRQIFILDWFYRKYINYLPRENIIFYEDLIISQGSCLKSIDSSAASLNELLTSKNENFLYNYQLVDILTEKMLANSNKSFLFFYSEKDVFSYASRIKS